MTTSVVDNGVNVEALLGAREAFADTPGDRAVPVAVDGDVGERHAQPVRASRRSTASARSRRTARRSASTSTTRCSSPPQDNGITPVEYVLVALGGCLTAGIAAVAQQRQIQLRSVQASVAAEMDLHGILGADPDVRNGFSGVTVSYRIDADATARGDRGPGRAVAEAVGGLRHPDQPDRRHGRGLLTAVSGGIAVPDTTTVVVGAGHCGLAMSRCLAERSVDHVVLERGEVAHSWRTQRWDSLRLLTPNWMTRLPGYAYRGDDPDGYLTAPEVVRLIEDYAAESAAPVLTGTTVTAVRPGRRGYVVQTDQGSWHAPTVVVATGATAVPAVPDRLAAQVPAGITTVTAADYRNPDRLPDGGVLVVGGSASGRPDRRGAAALRAAGDAGRRRARADAADLPGPRHPVVDGRVGPARRALRRGAGPGPGAQPAVDAARRLAAADGRPQRAAPARGAAGRPVRRHPRRDGAVLRVACPTCARWPTSSWAGCWTPSTPGRTRPGSTPTRRSGSRRPRCRHPSRCRCASAREIATIVWATGYRPDLSVARRRRCSTARAGSCTTAGSRPAPACT